MIHPGSSARSIATTLKQEGTLRSQKAFLALHYLRGRDLLKAGEYRFAGPTNTLEVYHRLVQGDVYVHTVVVPEGYNMFDIARAVEQAGLGSRQDFLQVARNQTELIADLDPQATSLEGYLFPDTYRFTRTQTLRDMASAMVERFRQQARELGLESDVHRIVILASIIEKETQVPAERPLVASVFQNRLEKNVVLAADPTVIYAALLNDRYDGVINQSDLQFDSAYNTYRYAGLPPGPIANPGRASLEAAMHPAETRYFYFVSDGQGAHRFAQTEAEHQRNVAAYRRSRRQPPPPASQP